MFNVCSRFTINIVQAIRKRIQHKHEDVFIKKPVATRIFEIKRLLAELIDCYGRTFRRPHGVIKEIFDADRLTQFFSGWSAQEILPE